MTLNSKEIVALRKRLGYLLGQKVGTDLNAATANVLATPAATIAPIGVIEPIVVPAGTYVDGAEPTGAEVDTAIEAASLVLETRLLAAEAKIDALIAALKASGQMDTE
jgi:hypothetical protein